MAHLIANHHNIIPRRVYGEAEPSNGYSKLMGRSGKIWEQQPRQVVVRVRRGFVVHSGSTTSSADQKVGSVGYLVNDCGWKWKVRRLVEKADEMRKVAHVQAEAFHVPVALFNDFFLLRKFVC